jgi:hypothetical protein
MPRRFWDNPIAFRISAASWNPIFAVVARSPSRWVNARRLGTYVDVRVDAQAPASEPLGNHGGDIHLRQASRHHMGLIHRDHGLDRCLHAMPLSVNVMATRPE